MPLKIIWALLDLITIVVSFIAFPGNAYGSPHHYLVWMRGDTAHLAPEHAGAGGRRDRRSPVARISLATRRRALKIIWALLDLITIVVLVSGLYCAGAYAAHRSASPT